MRKFTIFVSYENMKFNKKIEVQRSIYLKKNAKWNKEQTSMRWKDRSALKDVKWNKKDKK